MNSVRQAFFPSEDSARIVDACATELRPDDPALFKWHDFYVAAHKARIALDLDIVREKVPTDSRVLEMGSVPLLMTLALSKCGYQVTGCDLAPERYASTIDATGLNVVTCNIETEKLPFADDSFDAIIFNELFEHLRINPIFTLSEVLRVLRPGGLLTLSSPNLKSLGGIGNYLFHNRAYSCSANVYEQYEKLDSLGHMGHVREYTSTEVIEFLQRVGLNVNGLIFRGDYPNPLARTLIKTVPSLSPFISYIASKPVRRA